MLQRSERENDAPTLIFDSVLCEIVTSLTVSELDRIRSASKTLCLEIESAVRARLQHLELSPSVTSLFLRQCSSIRHVLSPTFAELERLWLLHPDPPLMLRSVRTLQVKRRSRLRDYRLYELPPRRLDLSLFSNLAVLDIDGEIFEDVVRTLAHLPLRRLGTLRLTLPLDWTDAGSDDVARRADGCLRAFAVFLAWVAKTWPGVSVALDLMDLEDSSPDLAEWKSLESALANLSIFRVVLPRARTDVERGRISWILRTQRRLEDVSVDTGGKGCALLRDLFDLGALRRLTLHVNPPDVSALEKILASLPETLTTLNLWLTVDRDFFAVGLPLSEDRGLSRCSLKELTVRRVVTIPSADAGQSSALSERNGVTEWLKFHMLTGSLKRLRSLDIMSVSVTSEEGFENILRQCPSLQKLRANVGVSRSTLEEILEKFWERCLWIPRSLPYQICVASLPRSEERLSRAAALEVDVPCSVA